MKVKIYTEKEFERQLRKLSKKYRSMLDDYDAFLTGLEQDPYQGTSPGRALKKVPNFKLHSLFLNCNSCPRSISSFKSGILFWTGI